MTVFVSAGTPIWNRTYANVSIPAMKFYTWNVEPKDAYLGDFLMSYKTTITTNAACALTVGARCSDWLSLDTANNTISGVPPPITF